MLFFMLTVQGIAEWKSIVNHLNLFVKDVYKKIEKNFLII